MIFAEAARANMPTLTERPRPPTLIACEKWAQAQDEDAIFLWETMKDGTSSRPVSIARLKQHCMGRAPPEIVAFYSSVGFAEQYCGSHYRQPICAKQLQPVQLPSELQGAYTSSISEPGACQKKTVLAHEDDGGMVISSNAIEWWESGCKVQSKSRPYVDHSITVKAACGGEGEHWNSEVTLNQIRLRGRTNVIVAEQNLTAHKLGLTVYERCG
jgi:hypothetical protein